RELANVLERAQILAEGTVITTDDLPDALFAAAPAAPAGDESGHSLHDAQRRHVLAVLREGEGDQGHPPPALGVSRRALYRLLEKYEIEKPHPAAGDQATPTVEKTPEK